MIIEVEKLKKLREKLLNKDASKEEELYVANLYRGIFGKVLTRTCKNCFIDGIEEILSYERRMDNKFQLKVGFTLLDPTNDSFDCSHRNMTDEKALHHLARHPEWIKRFSLYPENWKELVSGPQVDLFAELSKKTVNEIKEELLKRAFIESDFKGKYKTDLIELLKSAIEIR